MEKEIIEFEKAFREYLNASIIRAEIQEPYEPLSSEDEIRWLKEYFTQALQEAEERGIAKGRKEQMEKALTIQYGKPVSTNRHYNTGFNDAVCNIFKSLRKALTPPLEDPN